MTTDNSDHSPEVPIASGEFNFNQFAKWHDEFMDLCSARHRQGAEEYGPIAFLGNDVITFVSEELADIVNYCTFTYLKMRFLQEVLRGSGIDLTDRVVTGSSPDEVSPDPSTPPTE